MPPHVQELAAEVLGLAAHDRAKILELLLTSFEPEPATQKAWTDLALQRRQQVKQGQVVMVSGATALARIRAKIA